MNPKKGLLVSPEFPADSFWSYKYIMKYVRRRAAFPPLGLLTFAALMPQDEWEFELLDLNVSKPGKKKKQRLFEEADAVFVGAMNIQRDSLVELLSGPARGSEVPWVLGGPMASTYRDTILHPRTESDHILHAGLDHLVWGEATPWIGALNEALEAQPRHSEARPSLFIPERVLNEPMGSRKYLQDREIFKSLDNLPVPRWDLIDIRNYRSMMMQTTAGCRFRCNFCDIVQFNGGFARAKDKAAVKRELQAIYETGFRGGIFTVDDNFVSEPDAMVHILEGMVEFQRQYNYPFAFITQASIDLGKDSFSHLLALMKQAGFASVFLGIENPNPEALRQMNKIQNIKTNPAHTVAKLQQHGIEVFAGFIYGTDTDTRQSADLIVDFVERHGIFTSMTGKLTPMPHTPLYVDMEKQGRLLGNADGKNNIDENLQFQPIMGARDFHEGYSHILSTLFNRQALYKRGRSVLDRVYAHANIFEDRGIEANVIYAVVRSCLIQGLSDRAAYFGFLRDAIHADKNSLKQMRNEARSLTQFWHDLNHSAKEYLELEAEDVQRFGEMVHYAQEALVRFATDMRLAEISDFVGGVQEALGRGTLALEKAQMVYERAMQYCSAKSNLFRFPGTHLVKAYELIIKGLHYRTVVTHVLARSGALQQLPT